MPLRRPCHAHRNILFQVATKTIQELSEMNSAMSTQFGYREKYWLQELNASKAKLAEIEAQHELSRQSGDAQRLEHSALQSKYSRLLHIRNCLVSKFASSLRM
jgi:ribosomal protein S24E